MKNKYCFCESVSNFIALLVTKVFYRPARLIRRPFYLRGKKSLKIGHGLTIGHACRFDLDGKKKTLFIGDDCRMGDNTHIVAYESVRIGNNVLIASKVFISDTNHGNYRNGIQDSPYSKPNDRMLYHSPVSIGDNVWIGENVVVLPGVSIGDGCIVGANSVVNKCFGPNQIIGGIPARVIKKWNEVEKKWEIQKEQP